jgi:HTH-type transcriptional regulator/antitoxin HigA
MPRDFASLVKLHPPCAIHDQVDFENAQELIDALTSVPELSPGQADYLETLTILIDAYEAQHHALDLSAVGPTQALRHLLKENELNASDLGRLLGERSLGAKILSGQRELSKAHIRKLANHFGVSSDLFL